MATALIQSLVNGINPVVGASRDDLRAGDVVQLNAVGGPANNYAWSLAYKPEDVNRTPSSAELLGDIFGPGPVTFTVDHEGAYLIRLVVDAGLPTQDVQYVRLRFDTRFAGLKLVAAGERRDGTGIVPVDASAHGWADDQNFNVNRLKHFVKHAAASGRLIYVDANRGKNNLWPPNDPDVAENFADFSSINDAILAAVSNPEFNGTIPPSSTQPMVVAVRPGFYEEDVLFRPYVHVIGWPSIAAGVGEHPDFDRSVTVRCVNAGGPPAGTMTADIPNLGEYAYVANMVLENVGATTNALVRKVGEGDAYFVNVEFMQAGGGAANQGAALSVERGRALLHDCRVVQEDTFSGDSVAFRVQSPGGQPTQLVATDSMFIGPSIGTVDEDQMGANTALFSRCKFSQVGDNPSSFGLRTWSENMVLEDSHVTTDPTGVVTQAIQANADAAGTPGDLVVTLRRTRLGADEAGATLLGITINSTGVSGTPYLRLGSSEYGTITQVGSITRQALTLGTSLFYNNASSGLVSQTVQDAIDEIAGGGGGGTAPSNAPYVTWDPAAALDNNRVLLGGVGTTVSVGAGDDDPITVDLQNTAVSSGSYLRTDLTVDAQGRLTLAADGTVQYTFSRQMLVPGVVFTPPLTINEFDLLAFDGHPDGFHFLGGMSGALRVYLNQGPILPANTLLDVRLGSSEGTAVSILPAPFDLSGITPGDPPTTLNLAAGPFMFSAGNILQIQVTYDSVPNSDTDGLVVALTGNI